MRKSPPSPSRRNESPRRVRARLEKRGSMDVLRNQIIERKVIDLILANAVFKEVPYEIEESDVAALDLTAGGGERSDIPEAKPGGEPAEEKPEARKECGTELAGATVRGSRSLTP